MKILFWDMITRVYIVSDFYSNLQYNVTLMNLTELD